MLALDNGGVAISGRGRRRVVRGGAWRYHIMYLDAGLSADTDVLVQQ